MIPNHGGIFGAALLIALAPVARLCGQDDEALFRRIDAYVVEQMDQVKVPGIALAIVKEDEVIYLKGYGIAAPGGRQVTPQTPFIIGSITKSFTALAIMQLVEAGRIDLDASVQTYLPWFDLADSKATSLVTVRHLLNQTSGLSTYSGRLSPTSPDIGPSPLEQAVRNLKHTALTFRPGERFQYSNANYATLGAIVEAVSGVPYEQFIEQNVFRPLEMHNSFTSKSDAQEHGLSTGYRYWFGRPVAAENMPFPRSGIAHGYLVCSAEDLSNYLVAQMNGGTREGNSVLSPAGVSELHRPGANQENGYAMGWGVGPKIIGHDGDVPHFHADVLMARDAPWGLVLLFNGNSPAISRRLSGVSRNMMRMLLDEPMVPVAETGFQTLFFIPGLLVLCQLAGIGLTIRTVRQLRTRPDLRPKTRLSFAWRVGPSLLGNVAVAALVFIVLPRINNASFADVLLFAPDVGWLGAISGGFALSWGIISTVLVIRACQTTNAMDDLSRP